MLIELYNRSIDAGNGTHQVLVADGKIVAQWLAANQGYYTGDGSPELIGQSKAAIRGKGFKKVTGGRGQSANIEHDCFLLNVYNEKVRGLGL